MTPRPRSVFIVGWLFVLVGGGGIVQQLVSIPGMVWDTTGVRDMGIVLTLRLMALVGGIFILRGANWARWMLLVWMAYHIQISLQHSWGSALMHTVIFAGLTYLLFTRRASGYFRNVVRLSAFSRSA